MNGIFMYDMFYICFISLIMEIRIIFMGTSYFSVLSIEKVLKNKYNVLCVVTTTDKFSIRNKNIFVESAVKKYSILHALPILQSDDLKDSFFLSIFQKWHTEIIIIVAFRIIPKIILELPIFGSFNLHPSLLPNYRGAAPIQWVLMNGETKTGISTFQVDQNIDKGNLLLQKKISIKKKENSGSLFIRLSEIGAYLVIDTLIIYNYIVLKKQNTNFQFKIAPKLFRCNSKINWKNTIKNIYNNIRGLSPFPGSWCILVDNLLNKKVFKIYRADYLSEKHSKSFGNVEKNKITLKEGYLLILEYQLEGTPPVLVKDFTDKKLGVIAQSVRVLVS